MGHAQRRVAHLAGLFAKDGVEEPLLRRQLGDPLRRYLANEDVPVLDLRPDADDAPLVEVLQASSPTLGMSRVISSGPSLVSRASHSYSSMWIEV